MKKFKLSRCVQLQISVEVDELTKQCKNSIISIDVQIKHLIRKNINAFIRSVVWTQIVSNIRKRNIE